MKRSEFIRGSSERRCSAEAVGSYVIDCPRHEVVSIHLGHFEEEVVCSSQTK
jgi:hypothetical protein